MTTSAEQPWRPGDERATFPQAGSGEGNAAGDRPDVDVQRLLRSGAVCFEATLGLLGTASLLLFFPLQTVPLLLMAGGGLCFWMSRKRTAEALRYIRQYLPHAARQADARRIRSGQPILGLYIAANVLMVNAVIVRMAGEIFNINPRTLPLPGQAGEFEVVTPWPGPMLPAVLADTLVLLSVAIVAALIHFRTAYLRAHKSLQVAEFMEEMRDARSRRFASDYGGSRE